MAGVGVPPGLGGFGEVGEARMNFHKMVKGMSRLKEIVDNVEGDQLNTEKYVKELGAVCMEMFRATGAMFEQEHLRFINMFSATRSSGGGGGGFHKGVMEHKVIVNLRAVNGGKSISRQSAPKVHHSPWTSWRST